MGGGDFDKAEAFAVHESGGCSSAEAPCNAIASLRIAEIWRSGSLRETRTVRKDALSVFLPSGASNF